LTLHQLDSVMDGHLQPFIDALTEHFQQQKLKEELGSPA
jgi:protein subunit release factor A